MVERIIMEDDGRLAAAPEVIYAMKYLEDAGNLAAADALRKQLSSHPHRNRSFHYLPYHIGSGFEQKFLTETLALPDIKNLNLEVYYNGDNALTEFKIKCYKKINGKWAYIGLYTPDFLIIKRQDRQIHKAVIVETKGEIYKEKFKDRRTFMETEFTRHNNKAFGYERFDYLYLEDTLSEKDRINITWEKIKRFFREENSSLPVG